MVTSRGSYAYGGPLMLDQFGARSKRLHRTSVPGERSKTRRLLAGAAAVLLLCTAAACGASVAGSKNAPGGGTSTAPGAVSIPTGNLTAYDRCLLDAGEEIIGVDPGYPGESPGYVFRMVVPSGMDQAAIQAHMHQCDGLQPSPPPPPTEAQIRQIYDRWVGEYHCLIGLGYQPDPPPSVETFVASYNLPHQAPWMPTDGVDTDHWTQAQYDQAKGQCTLEFYTRLP